MELQKLIFDEIRARIPIESTWSRELAKTLHLGRDAIYRRERGEVQLTLKEVELLCKKFGISLDKYLLADQYAVVFKHTSLNRDDLYNYKQYLDQLLKHLHMIHSCQRKEIIFCADDIPIFHFMDFPELTYFKLYTWNQAVLNLGTPFEAFVYELKKQNLEPTFKKLHEIYQAIPSREIWTKSTISPFLELLAYYQSINSFQSEQSIITLNRQLKQLVENLKAWTMGQEKQSGVGFDLYVSPVNLGLSQMVCQFDEKQSVSVKLYTINSIATMDKNYVEETIDWIRGILNKSSCLSRLSEKERIFFFKDMEQSVAGIAEKISSNLCLFVISSYSMMI